MKMIAISPRKQRTKPAVTLEMLRELRKRVTRTWKGKATAVQEVRRQRTKPYDR